MKTFLVFGSILAGTAALFYPKSAQSTEPTPLPSALISQVDDPVEPGIVVPQHYVTGPDLVARPPSAEYLQRRQDFSLALAQEQAAWQQQMLPMAERRRRRALLKQSMLNDQGILKDLWDFIYSTPEGGQ